MAPASATGGRCTQPASVAPAAPAAPDVSSLCSFLLTQDETHGSNGSKTIGRHCGVRGPAGAGGGAKHQGVGGANTRASPLPVLQLPPPPSSWFRSRWVFLSDCLNVHHPQKNKVKESEKCCFSWIVSHR